MPPQALPPIGGDRRWAVANEGASTGLPEATPAGWRFTAMTYNVLSDALLHKYARDYASVPPAELEWSRRLGHMLQEIRRHTPDVLALQEVERLSDFLGPLSELGYDGRLVANTGHRIDGSAILWNTRRFTLLACQGLEYQRYGVGNNEALLVQLQPLQGAASAGAQAAGPTATSAMAAADQAVYASAGPAPENGALSPDPTLPVLTVATLHMAHNAELDEMIKPAQARVLLAAAQRLASGGPAVILGDFNSLPGSTVHALCSGWGATGGKGSACSGGSGHHSAGHGDGAADAPQEAAGGPGAGSSAAAVDGSGSMADADATDADIAALAGAPQGMRLASAYGSVCGREPEFTAVGINPGRPHCTVDYVWYTPQASGCRLQPGAVLQPPDLSVLQHGRPSAVLPSDHIPLVAEFDLQLAA